MKKNNQRRSKGLSDIIYWCRICISLPSKCTDWSRSHRKHIGGGCESCRHNICTHQGINTYFVDVMHLKCKSNVTPRSKSKHTRPPAGTCHPFIQIFTRFCRLKYMILCPTRTLVHFGSGTFPGRMCKLRTQTLTTIHRSFHVSIQHLYWEITRQCTCMHTDLVGVDLRPALQ